MNSCVEMTMVKKEQGQDDYFSQQSILLTLPTYISATDYQKDVGLQCNCEKYALLTEIVILSLFLTIVIPT